MIPGPNRRRRSLTNVTGRIDTAGDARLSKKLAEALDVPASRETGDGPDRAHVHGFHAYPARMHPETAARLIRAIVPERGIVLDPFCGSGTVLVEAMLAGRASVGSDLNPLAVLLARAKTHPREDAEYGPLLDAAIGVAGIATERRHRKAGATRRFSEEEVRLFEPHVLLELDGLRVGIEAAHRSMRDDLYLVLSALLVKLSKQTGDTTEHVQVRRTAAGYPSKLFVKKTEEYIGRLREFHARVPKGAPTPRTFVEDATSLRLLKGVVDTIISSPPYAATYDYLAHHALRLRWLGLKESNLKEREFGARRAYRNLNLIQARKLWLDELTVFFRAAVRIVRPGGRIALVVADSAVENTPMLADEIVPLAGKPAGLTLAARASQTRQHFHTPNAQAFAKVPRREHVILLERR